MDKSPPKLEPVVIPYQKLSPTALQRLIEYFVLREGTEYGPMEVPLEIKHAQVMRLLEKGAARIVFNPVMDSANIEVVQAAGRRTE
jgi:uncharacterized protein YheU (UPF0270 family)